MKRSKEEDHVWIEIFIQRGPTTKRRRTSGQAELSQATPQRGMAEPYRMRPPLRGMAKPCPTTRPHPRNHQSRAEPCSTTEDIPQRGTQTRSQHPSDDTMTATVRPHATDFVVTHPSQTRFVCPDAGCRLTYPSHHSLVRHVGVAHKRMTLKLSFKCALCDYIHTNLRSTSLPFRHTHGAAVPPLPVAGSSEKACPHCHLTFPSNHSCSTHMREKHMEAASAQRAREAAEKTVRQGESTARLKWSEAEISKFKEALTKLGPDSNIKIAAAIGSRTPAQVNVFKWRFLKANPSWLQQHYHPAPTAANATSSRSTSNSPRLTPEDQPPSDGRMTQAPPAADTSSSRSSSAIPESHAPPNPSTTQRQRRTGTRAHQTLPAHTRRRTPSPLAPTNERRSPDLETEMTSQQTLTPTASSSSQEEATPHHPLHHCQRERL